MNSKLNTKTLKKKYVKRIRVFKFIYLLFLYQLRVVSAAVVKKDEEIRHERELALEIDAARKVLEQQLRETQARVEEAEDYARKEAKRIAAKYEGRVRK